MKNRKLVLVANSPSVTDINDRLSENDLIVRFNIPLHTALHKTGERTDILFLANTVDLMESRLKSGSEFLKYFTDLTNVKVFFPYEDELIKEINPLCKVVNRFLFIKFKKFINNWNNDKYILFFLERNVDVEVISKHIYWDAKEKLNTNEVSSILSTGFLATLFFLNSEKYKDYLCTRQISQNPYPIRILLS